MSEQLYRYADVPHPNEGLAIVEAATEVDDVASSTADNSAEKNASSQPTETQPPIPTDKTSIVKTKLTEKERTRIKDLDAVSVALKPEYAKVLYNTSITIPYRSVVYLQMFWSDSINDFHFCLFVCSKAPTISITNDRGIANIVFQEIHAK